MKVAFVWRCGCGCLIPVVGIIMYGVLAWVWSQLFITQPVYCSCAGRGIKNKTISSPHLNNERTYHRGCVHALYFHICILNNSFSLSHSLFFLSLFLSILLLEHVSLLELIYFRYLFIIYRENMALDLIWKKYMT